MLRASVWQMLDSDRTPPPNVTKNIKTIIGALTEKSVFFPIKCQTLVRIFEIQKSVKKWLSIGPPIFSPEIFFTKMTQNGLKWILNTTLKSVTFGRRVHCRLNCSPKIGHFKTFCSSPGNDHSCLSSAHAVPVDLDFG